MTNELKAKAEKIKMLITDCDGVLTDGGVYYGENGELMKKFNIKDGMAVERLRNLCGHYGRNVAIGGKKGRETEDNPIAFGC